MVLREHGFLPPLPSLTMTKNTFWRRWVLEIGITGLSCPSPFLRRERLRAQLPYSSRTTTTTTFSSHKIFFWESCSACCATRVNIRKEVKVYEHRCRKDEWNIRESWWVVENENRISLFYDSSFLFYFFHFTYYCTVFLLLYDQR